MKKGILIGDAVIAAAAFGGGFALGRHYIPEATAKVGEVPAPDIADFASRYKGLFYKRRKDTAILPEVAFAQAIAESSDSDGNFGKGLAAIKANNFFGIQADASWKGDVFIATDSAGTPGVHWRSYKTAEDSINDYYDFISSNSNYKIDLTTNTSDKQIDAIASGGYGGSDTAHYATFLKSISPRAKRILSDVDDKYHDYKSAAIKLGTNPILMSVAAIVVIGIVLKKESSKNISGVSDIGTWIEKNPLPTAIGAGLLLALGVGYYSGKKGKVSTDNIQVDMSTLPDPSGVKYASVADNIQSIAETEMFQSADFLEALKNLTPDELKAVAKAFGKRQIHFSAFGVNVPLGNEIDIFGLFQREMTSGNLSTMKKLWAGTGLWT